MAKKRWSDEDLIRAVAAETTWRGVQRRLGLREGGADFVRKHADRIGIDYTHFPRHRRGWEDDQLRNAVASSESLAQVLRDLGLVGSGRSYENVGRHISRLGLDTSHFTGQAWVGSRGQRPHPSQRYTTETIFCQDSTYGTRHLLKALLNRGLKARRCEMCGLAKWLEAPISLEVDHVNGHPRDHRLENLRVLCPNCHATTPTWRGRKNRKTGDSSSCG